LLMVGQCYPFPSLGSPAARRQNQGSSSSHREDRLDAFLFFLPPLPTPACQLGWTDTTSKAWKKNPTPCPTPNKEDGKPLPFTPASIQPWRLRGLCSSPSSRQEKKVGGKKEVPLRPCMGSSNSENKHGIGAPLPARSSPALTPHPGRVPLADQQRNFPSAVLTLVLAPARTCQEVLAPGGAANFFYGLKMLQIRCAAFYCMVHYHSIYFVLSTKYRMHDELIFPGLFSETIQWIPSFLSPNCCKCFSCIRGPGMGGRQHGEVARCHVSSLDCRRLERKQWHTGIAIS
jgi:hypothetical protein